MHGPADLVALLTPVNRWDRPAPTPEEMRQIALFYASEAGFLAATYEGAGLQDWLDEAEAQASAAWHCIHFPSWEG